MKRVWIVAAALLLLAAPGWAKMDLTTLPGRDAVQLTIYNSADMTLVREQRALTLKQGANRLQFSWANTLIDPTSIDLGPRDPAADVTVRTLVFPPRVSNLGLWHIDSAQSGRTVMELSYLTSGLTWRAFYAAFLSPDESTMRLDGYVRVDNQSGEDYAEAQTRLIVGRVQLLDRIADLANRKHPYGRPGPPRPPMPVGRMDEPMAEERAPARAKMLMAQAEPKEIKKEGVSEYFLYTIEGRETIADGWAKRLPSFTVEDVPVVNLYKFEAERFGDRPVRFLRFKNDQEHKLGETPIPGGELRVFRTIDKAGHLSYEGRSNFQYIPVGEDVELNLGPARKVLVTAKRMNFKSFNYMFTSKGRVEGWDEEAEYRIEVKNTRSVPVEVQATRNFPTPHWELSRQGFKGEYQKVDLDTVRFTLKLPPRSEEAFTYTLTTHHGRRAE
jgi:hypothetical protein